MIKAVLRLHHKYAWPLSEISNPSFIMRKVDLRLGDGDVVRNLVEIYHADFPIRQVSKEIRSYPNVARVDTVEISRGSALGIIECVGECCHSIAEAGCFLLSADYFKGGVSQLSLLFPEKDSLKRLVAILKNREVPFSISRVDGMRQEELLTARQIQMIRMAFNRGIFEYPRKISLTQLAQDAGISLPTLIQTLRRGQRKIISRFLKNQMHLS
jgi:predicted DNA binding protein